MRKKKSLAPNASWLKDAREKAGLTQAFAARASGVSIVTIQAIEQGRSPGSPSTLARLADALGVDPPAGSVQVLSTAPLEGGLSGARIALRDAIVSLTVDSHLDDLAALLVAAAWVAERRSRQDPKTGRVDEAHGTMPDLAELMAPGLSPDAALGLVKKAFSA